MLDTNRSCTKCHEHGKFGLDERCLDCHGGIRRLVRDEAGFHGRQGRNDCARCHPDHAGRDFDLIDWEDGSEEQFRHQRTGWPLTGRHGELKCRDCHIPKYQQANYLEGEPLERGGRTWLGLDTQCRSCHEDLHKGELGDDCSRCHGTSKFKPAARLDHSKTKYPLTGKHADVACNKCHLVQDKVFIPGPGGKQNPKFTGLAFKECSDCHKDVHAGALGPACGTCHVTDDFKKVDRARFDHRKTAWPLRGKHAQVRCESCHDPAKAWGKKPKFGRCVDCHSDLHNGTATLAGKKVDCAACHDENGYVPSRYTVTQHQETDYRLEGKHAAVQCSKCHVKPTTPAAAASLGKAGILMRPNYTTCRDCHDDSHGGQLSANPDGGACESCHTVNGWKPSVYAREKHDLLAVTLAGKHGATDCAACHGLSRPGLGPVPVGIKTGTAKVALRGIETECRACHLDVHQGRFEAGGASPSPAGCKSCHGQASFNPSLVTVELHRKFGYALEGGHQAVPCIDCHKALLEPATGVKLLKAAGPARNLEFKEPHERCEDCHQDPHAGQFAHRPDQGSCAGCHDTRAFRPASKFDHERDAKFALKGGHLGLACDRCHKMNGTPEGGRMVVYRPMAKECRDCHSNAAPTGRKR